MITVCNPTPGPGKFREHCGATSFVAIASLTVYILEVAVRESCNNTRQFPEDTLGKKRSGPGFMPL
jgi:hypothetical protein